jgi:hypothetical protein
LRGLFHVAFNLSKRPQTSVKVTQKKDSGGPLLKSAKVGSTNFIKSRFLCLVWHCPRCCPSFALAGYTSLTGVQNRRRKPGTTTRPAARAHSRAPAPHQTHAGEQAARMLPARERRPLPSFPNTRKPLAPSPSPPSAYRHLEPAGGQPVHKLAPQGAPAAMARAAALDAGAPHAWREGVDSGCLPPCARRQDANSLATKEGGGQGGQHPHARARHAGRPGQGAGARAMRCATCVASPCGIPRLECGVRCCADGAGFGGWPAISGCACLARLAAPAR